jgi:hypothetical protein
MSQSQLANVIYYPSQGQSGQARCVTRRNSYAQPCNPPTPTSATANFPWDWDDAARYRGQNPTPYVAPAPVPLRSCDIDDEMEDEQTVEELLNTHSPNQMHLVPPPHRQQLSKFRHTTAQQQQQQQQQQQFSTAFSPPPQLGSPTLYDATPAQSASSLFVNTDPFYLAAVQSSSLAATAPPSFFAQAARPAANSPFNLNLSGQQGHHALDLESRTVLVGAGQSR